MLLRETEILRGRVDRYPADLKLKFRLGECFMKDNSFESMFIHGETEESHTGKSDDGQSDSETKKSGVEVAPPDGLDAIDCQKRQEFEMDGRRMGECSPDERGQGHGSPQPLDPTEPEDDDSESDGENNS